MDNRNVENITEAEQSAASTEMTCPEPNPEAAVSGKGGLNIPKLIAIAAVVLVLGIAGAIFLPDYLAYSGAVNDIAEGDYEEARAVLTELAEKDYIDSAAQLRYCNYSQAGALLAEGELERAARMYESAGDFMDSEELALKTWYQFALELVNRGEVSRTQELFEQLGDYEDSARWSEELLYVQLNSGDLESMSLAEAVELLSQIDPQSDPQRYMNILRSDLFDGHIATGKSHTVMMRDDGTVMAVGDNTCGQCSVGDWTDIYAVAAAGNYTVGLRRDGTILAVGDNSYGQCDITLAAGAKMVYAGSTNSAGLLSTGRVVTSGYNGFTDQGIASWSNISKLSVGMFALAALDENGKVYCTKPLTGFDSEGQYVDFSVGMSAWVAVTEEGTICSNIEAANGLKNVVSAEAGERYIVVLYADGTAECIGIRPGDDLDISGWKSIVEISAKSSHVAALLADGTVVTAGGNDFGQCSTEHWSAFEN